jgi:hypothetical protein
MKRVDKETARTFIPETVLYGALAAGFCFGVARLLGRPMASLFHRHPVGYGLLALGLMVFQGLVLERTAHAICSLFRRPGKAPG